MQQPSVHEVIEAANVTPGFIGAFYSAPPQVTINGKTYLRDDARNTQERVWYLAAVAMTRPKEIERIANLDGADLGYGFEESEVASDPDVVAAKAAVDAAHKKTVDAQTAVLDAQNKLTGMQGAAAAKQKQIDGMQAQANELQAQIDDMGRVKDAGEFFTAVFTMGGSKIAPWADKKIRLGNAQNSVSQLKADLTAIDVDTPRQILADAQKALKQAQSEEKAAVAAYKTAQDTVRQRLRAADLLVQQQQASALAQQRAQAAADNAAAMAAAGGGGDPFGDYSGDSSDGGFSPEWGSTDWATTDPNADLGSPDYLDLDEQADLWGDEDFAYKMAALNGDTIGPPMIGVNTVVSPWAFDRYYAGYDLDNDPVWGADTATIVGGIIAGIAAAAPAVYKAVAPPPSAGDTGSTANAGSGNLVDDVLTNIGAKKTINDAASAAGGSAGNTASKEATGKIDMWLGIGVVAFIGILLLHRKS